MSESSLKTTVVGGVIAGFSTLAATLAPYYLTKPETEPSRPQREYRSRYESRQGDGQKSPVRPNATAELHRPPQALAVQHGGPWGKSKKTPAAGQSARPDREGLGREEPGREDAVATEKISEVVAPAVAERTEDRIPEERTSVNRSTDGKYGKFPVAGRGGRPVREVDVSEETSAAEGAEPQAAEQSEPSVSRTAEAGEPKRRKR